MNILICLICVLRIKTSSWARCVPPTKTWTFLILVNYIICCIGVVAITIKITVIIIPESSYVICLIVVEGNTNRIVRDFILYNIFTIVSVVCFCINCKLWQRASLNNHAHFLCGRITYVCNQWIKIKLNIK